MKYCRFSRAVLFTCWILTLPAYGFELFDVRFTQEIRSLSEDAVQTIVESVFADRLASGAYYRASVRVYSSDNAIADFLAVYLYKKESFLLECYQIVLDKNGRAVSVIDDFREPYNEPDTEPCGSCPDPTVEVYVETAMDGVPAGAALWCYNEAVNAGFKAVLDLAANATSKRFKDFLSCPKLKCAIHVGHGNTWVIAFANDIITNEWFESLPQDYLKGQVHMYGSCLAHNPPLETAILGAGVKAYMAGDETLNIQHLQNTMFQISRAMFNGTEVKKAFDNSDARLRGWGISGNPPGGPWYIKETTVLAGTDNKAQARALTCRMDHAIPRMTISYYLGSDQHVRLKVYSISGTLRNTLVDSQMRAGVHTVHWNDSGGGKGVYLVTLHTEKGVTVQKTIRY